MNWRLLLRIVLAGGCVALFAAALRSGDLSRAAALIVQAPGIWVIVLPPLAASLMDAAAWQQIFSACGARVSLMALMATRLSADGVAQSLPSGVVFGEATALYLLRKRSSLTAETGIVSLASRKLFATFGHGLMLALAAILGFRFLRVSSFAVVGRGGLEWAPPLAALALVAAALLSPRLVLRGFVARRFPNFPKLLRRAGTPAEAAGSLRTLLYFGMWIAEPVESFLILRALGSHLTFGQVMSFDVLLSLLRSFAVFAPGGLGIQDAGFMLFLRALKAGPEAAALATAFVIVKRARELLFVACGYILLVLRASPKAPQDDPERPTEQPLSAWGAS